MGSDGVKNENGGNMISGEDGEWGIARLAEDAVMGLRKEGRIGGRSTEMQGG